VSEWKTLRLGDAISIKHGYAFKGEYFSDEIPGPTLLTPGNFAVGGGFKHSKPKYYLGAVPEEFRLQGGDLVVTMTDLSKAGDTLGYPAVIPPVGDYLHNQRIGLVAVDKDMVDKFFLFYALRTDAYRQHVLAGATGSTVRHTSPKRIAEYRARVPGLDEQRAIAGALGALDDKIAVNDRIASTALDLAEAEFARFCATAADYKRLNEVIELKYGKALPANSRVRGEFPVYGSGGISGSHDVALVPGPGVIVGRKGTVGAVYWSEKDFFPIDTTFYVQLQQPEIPMEFAYFMLKNLGLDGMNSDSAVPGLNRSNALALRVKVPGEEELQEFRPVARPLFALRETVSVESARLAELRDTLLPKLMSGQIRVREAEEAVGSV
jgi:type I restriction enzyme S subunit